jgi:hypothetical protein
MTEDMLQRRARIFISCGQNKYSNEVAIANQIVARLEKLGFAPYIAVEEQTLRGLKGNIFRQLRRSEYFIFVDFKREKLEGEDAYRGSLFSHQELALASYLDIEVLALQEDGVKKNDGILGFLQTNAIRFTDADRHLLPSVIADNVRERGWDPNWRNELVLERDPKQFTDPFVRNVGKSARFFHINVQNLHRDRIATNCFAYLEKATKLNPSTKIDIRTVEIKWRGYTLPNAHILPQTTRDFDAFFIYHDVPEVLQFQFFTDASEFIPQIAGAGTYRLEYVVVSDNFPPVRGTFTLDLSGSLESTVLALRPERRADVAELPTHDVPWDGSVSLRRVDMYGDDGR